MTKFIEELKAQLELQGLAVYRQHEVEALLSERNSLQNELDLLKSQLRKSHKREVLLRSLADLDTPE